MNQAAALRACFVDDRRDFAVLDSSLRGPQRVAADRQLVAGMQSTGVVSVVLCARRRSRVARTAYWLTSAPRIAAARRRIVRAGATLLGLYAVFPDAERPTILYELGSPACAYAERLLLPIQARRFTSIRAFLSRVVGFDPSVGAVIVVGRVP